MNDEPLLVMKPNFIMLPMCILAFLVVPFFLGILPLWAKLSVGEYSGLGLFFMSIWCLGLCWFFQVVFYTVWNFLVWSIYTISENHICIQTRFSEKTILFKDVEEIQLRYARSRRFGEDRAANVRCFDRHTWRAMNGKWGCAGTGVTAVELKSVLKRVKEKYPKIKVSEPSWFGLKECEL